jgi:PAS domain S-box-containing protein
MDMPLKTKPAISHTVDLQTLVESHASPFVIIDRNYRIVAANSAYQQVFGKSLAEVIGHACYEVSHHREKPCYEFGDECPHLDMFMQNRQVSCVHIHHDGEDHECQVRISSHPLQTCDGELLMGESIEILSPGKDIDTHTRKMVGSSKAYLKCLDQLERIAATDATALLLGETGTGKELAAQHIHSISTRTAKPFVVLDCTVLPETLFESEVFGHERGAFTGSVGDKCGLFEQADGGTLFIDEVGELPLPLQAKLLRSLETGQFRRVGSTKVRTVDVRIVCATNRNLLQQVSTGSFREDLYYRIACLSVRLPSLRERLDDVGVLAHFLLNQISVAVGCQYKLTSGAIDWLKHHDYPGNIRELRNILMVATSQSAHNVIHADDIKLVFEQRPRNNSRWQDGVTRQVTIHHEVGAEGAIQADSLDDLEGRYIAGLLTKYSNNRKRVASEMGISERTLYRKIKRYSLI